MNAIATMPGALQSATGLIRRSVGNLAQDAHVVANSGDLLSRDTLEALIDARQQVLYTRAGAKMISAANEMIGSLLDVRG